jgi:hypothetical protein
VDWKKIDLWPEGPAGVEARYRIQDGVCYCFISGSDHWLDWVHHFLPRAQIREIDAGWKLAQQLRAVECDRFVIGGHSLGGVIAEICACILYMIRPVMVYTFGSKRGYVKFHKCVHYRRKGDIVPFLPPWRPKLKCTVFGKWMPFWMAHRPKVYENLMKEAGLK